MTENTTTAAPAATSYVHTVPDHCDRVVWRGRYLSLPLQSAPAAQEAEPAIQWQKRHPDHDDGAWHDCTEGDAKWWQEQHRWEVRKLCYAPETARSVQRPQADAGAVPEADSGDADDA